MQSDSFSSIPSNRTSTGLDPYVMIARAQMQMELAHRGDLLAELGLHTLLLIGTAFLWSAVYTAQKTTVAGVGRESMVAYAVLSVLLTTAFSTTVQNTVHS